MAGPRRAQSVDRYLTQTRVAAILALLALVAGVVTDMTATNFWSRHALLTSLVGSVIVVMLSVAVINEVLERRRRQRWSVLAQYVMFELVRNARMTWSGVLDAAGLFPTHANPQDTRDAGARTVRDTAGLTAALRAILDDHDRRVRMHREIAFLAQHADEVLGRWAAVMLNAAIYAEVIDWHVELAGDISWIVDLLDSSHPPSDARRQRRARSSPAVQIEPELGGAWLADRIVVIVQLAEELDRGTLDLALRIVPVQWWQARLGTTVQSTRAESDEVAGSGSAPTHRT
jgi:hypothetical protein